jgi:hypothetical protein
VASLATTTPFDFQYDQNTDPGTAFRFRRHEGTWTAARLPRRVACPGARSKARNATGKILASQEYNNAFNRYVTGFNANTGERNQLYNR